jgi:hypothetical protein
MSEGMQHQLQQQEQRKQAIDDSKQQEFASGYLGKDDQKLQERVSKKREEGHPRLTGCPIS